MAALDHPLGLLEHHLGHLHVARGLLVEGRGDDLGLGVARHLGHLLGALVDEQHNQIDVGMVVGYGVDNRLHEHRLTRLGLGDNQRALPLADGREEVYDARGEVVVAVARQAELLVGKERRHVLELHPVADVFGLQAVDFVDTHQREVLLALLRGRMTPLTVSPGFRPKNLICEGET